jgi:hypothetical protein
MPALTVRTHPVAPPTPDVAYDAEYARIDTAHEATNDADGVISTSDPKAIVWIGSDQPSSPTDPRSIVDRRRARYAGDIAVQLPENKATSARLEEQGYPVTREEGGWMPSLAATIEWRNDVRDPGHYVTNSAAADGCVIIEFRTPGSEFADQRPLRPGEARRLSDGDTRLVIRSCRDGDVCLGSDHVQRAPEVMAMGWAYLLTVTTRPQQIDATRLRTFTGPTSTGTPDIGVMEGDDLLWMIDSHAKAKAIIVRYGIQMLSIPVRNQNDAHFKPITATKAHRLAQLLGWHDGPLTPYRTLNSTCDELFRREIGQHLPQDMPVPTAATPEAPALLYRLGILRPHLDKPLTLRVRMSYGDDRSNGPAWGREFWSEHEYEDSMEKFWDGKMRLSVDDVPADHPRIEDDHFGQPRYWCVTIPATVMNALAD